MGPGMPDRRVLLIYVAGFVGPLGGNAVLAMLNALEVEFQVTNTEILLSIPFFMFPFALLQFFSGPVSDRYDRRRLIVGGFAVYGLASLASTLAVDLGTFLAARFAQGVGFAFISPVLLALLGDYTTEARRGLAMGFFGASITAGTAMGPLLGGAAADADWRYAFYLLAALSLLIALLFETNFKEASGRRDGAKEAGRIDVLGVALLSAAAFLAFFAFVGAISFTAAVVDEPPHSFSPIEVGLILTTAGVAGIFASPAAGALVDRMGRARTGLTGFALTGAAILPLGAASGLPQFALILFVLGIGAALVWASLNTITVELVPERKGTVSSVFNGFRFLGFALAVPLLTPVFEAGGVGAVYALAAGSCLVSFALLGLLATRLGAAPTAS